MILKCKLDSILNYFYLWETMNYLLMILTTLTLMTSGCSTTKPQVKSVVEKEPTKQVATSRKTSEVKQSGLPTWIMNPNKNGYICDVGTSQLQAKMSITKKVAFITAKAGISEQIRIYVETEQKREASCISEECKSKFSTKTHLSSTNMIQDIAIEDSYTDEEHSIYYVRVCTKI